jgi:hypothetical protein
VWKPPIDPVTGEARWDQAAGPIGAVAPAVGAPGRTGQWRKRAKARDITAGAVAAGVPAPPATTAFDQATPAARAGAPGAGLPGTAWTADRGGTPPPATPGDPAGPPHPDGGPARTRNRTTIVVLVVVLVLVIGGIAYFALKQKGSTTATSVPATPTSSPVAADTELAASINLRLTDLPAGWALSTATGQVARPPTPPAAAQVQANRAFAVCVGASYPVVAGLFGESVLPGQTASVRSSTFQSGSDPNIQMHSVTTVMSSVAAARALTTPFANPNFVNCFGQYQTALVSAAVPGATAAIQTVALVAPTGVQAYGYVTMLTIPNQSSQVIGEAFMVGGRIETRLEPTTNGPAVPSEDFFPAYNAVVGRIAASVNN